MKHFYCYETEGRYWVYDRYSNQIIDVEKPYFEIISTFEKHRFSEEKIFELYNSVYSRNLLSETIGKIREYQKTYDVLKPFDLIKTIQPLTDEQLKEKYDNEVNQVVFNLTENCNNKCEYCKYAGSYKYEKLLNTKSMSYDVINNTIDFLTKTHNSNETLVVGFYGGEPLLEFEKIKYIVSNTNNLFEKIRYSFTTNGLLFNEGIYKFCIDYNIEFKISLDGPIEIHDRYRKKTNGESTFNLIQKNIASMKKIDYEFYSKNVGFICTLTPPYELKKTVDFFDKNTEPSQIVMLNNIDPMDTTFLEKVKTPDGLKKYSQEFKELLNEYKNKMLSNTFDNRTKILSAMFSRNLYIMHERGVYQLSEKQVFPNGTCYPGLDKLFVSTNGDLGVCEKIGDRYLIGNVTDGFDLKIIKKLFSDYCKVVDQQCLDCWAYRLCGTCFNSAIEGKQISLQRKKEICKNKLTRIISDLKLYSEIKYSNPGIFENYN